MSINDFIGPVSVQSAAVLISMGGAITAISIALIMRRSKKEVEHDYELAMYKAQRDAAYVSQRQADSQALELAKVAMNKEVQLSKIDKHFLDIKPNKRIEGEA